MTRKDRKSSDFETLHIGKIIEEEVRSQERSITWLSRKIHCDRRNVYDIFSRASIDTSLLYKLSMALNRDFFACYSTDLQHIENKMFTPPQKKATALAYDIDKRQYVRRILYSRVSDTSVLCNTNNRLPH